MTEAVRSGSIFIRERAVLADSLKFETEPYSKNWQLLKKLDGYGVNRRVRAAGWSFFFVAGDVRAIAFGANGDKRTRRAANRIMARLSPGKFNCVEISEVTAKHFLGVPYVRVTAHSRHIQQGDVLLKPSKNTGARSAAALARP